MAINQDIENSCNDPINEISRPLIGEPKISNEEEAELENSNGGSIWMVLLSTLVAVCGSYEFGTCVRIEIKIIS